jgi:hypothetical protein
MSLKLKVLGLGVLAALAISAVVVLGASAEAGGHFTAEGKPTSLIGTQDAAHPTLIETAAGKVECSLELQATMTAEKEFSIPFTPIFSKCKLKGGAEEENVTVAVNGCVFRLTIRAAEVDKKHSTVHIQCPVNLEQDLHTYATGNERRNMIEVDIPGVCKITIPEQTPTKGGVIYKTGGAAKTHDYDVTATLEEVHYTQHGLCNFLGGTTATQKDLKFSTQVTVKGFNSSKVQVGVTATGAV